MDSNALFDRCTGFEWDAANHNKNSAKHGVEWEECEELFFNAPLIVAEDSKHSQQEARYYALGKTNAERRVFIVFTLRKNKIRVISARDMSRKEREIYEKA